MLEHGDSWSRTLDWFLDRCSFNLRWPMLQWRMVETYAVWPPLRTRRKTCCCWSAALLLIHCESNTFWIILDMVTSVTSNIFQHLPTFQHFLKIAAGLKRPVCDMHTLWLAMALFLSLALPSTCSWVLFFLASRKQTTQKESGFHHARLIPYNGP